MVETRPTLTSHWPDLSIFDFTNLYAARNSCRAVVRCVDIWDYLQYLLYLKIFAISVRKGFPLLLAVAGDSLLEPFWPDGTGCARSVDSSVSINRRDGSVIPGVS